MFVMSSVLMPFVVGSQERDQYCVCVYTCSNVQGLASLLLLFMVKDNSISYMCLYLCLPFFLYAFLCLSFS